MGLARVRTAPTPGVEVLKHRAACHRCNEAAPMTLSIVPTRASDAHPTAPPARGCEASHTRRALLAGAAAAPALALPAIAVEASANGSQIAPDPHPAWFAEWRALVDWCNGPPADGDE